MNFFNILSITKRITKTLFRDYKFILISVLAPIIIILIFAVITRSEIQSINLGVVNLDNELQNFKVVENFLNFLDKDTYKIIYFQSLDDAKNAFYNDRIDSIILFPQGISEVIYFKISGVPLDKSAQITLYLDYTNETTSSRIKADFETANFKFSSSLGIENAISLEPTSIYKTNFRSKDYYSTGIIAFIVFTLGLLVSNIVLSSEKSSGMLERVIVSSLNSFEIVLGYFLAILLLSILQIIILLFSYVLILKGILSFQIILVFLFLILLSSSAIFLGIAISSYFSITQSYQISISLLLPTLLISGIFWSSKELPIIGKILSYIFPTTFGIEAIRSIIIKQIPIYSLLFYALILFIFNIIFMIAASFSIRKSI